MKKRNGYRFGILAVSCTVLAILLAVFVLKGYVNDSTGESAEKDAPVRIETDIEADIKSDIKTDDAGNPEKSADTGIVQTERADLQGTHGPEAEAEAEPETNTENDFGAEEAYQTFYHTEITEEIKARITGVSYPYVPDVPDTSVASDADGPLLISYEDLAYVHVLYYDFDGQAQEGELVCNQAIAQDLTEIFMELYDNRYPIEKICLIEEYGGDDEASMADNNTSCFNYRTVPGSSNISKHAYGLAIDINPLYNPYVRTRGGKTLVSPENGADYADRSADFPYKIDREDLCYQLFIQHGFSWGGAWKSSKDYQHFEKE